MFHSPLSPMLTRQRASAPDTRLRHTIMAHINASNHGRPLTIYQRISFLSEWHAAPTYK